MENRKNTVLAFCLLLAGTFCFAQGTRDHRGGYIEPPPPGNRQVLPPPVRARHQPGLPAISIDPGKWYYIRKAARDQYMHIGGHKNPERSYAILAIDDMQPDNTSQQWRFIPTSDDGSAIYKLQNRKYSGLLYTAFDELYMEFKRDRNGKKDVNNFLLVPNPDKTWYFLPRVSENKNALEVWKHNGRHCMPAASAPLIGGRVLLDYECAAQMYRSFVRAMPFTGEPGQKWILEEVKESTR